MDDATRVKALEWLNQKWKGEHDCPICGVNDWQLGEIVLWEDEPGSTTPGMAGRLTMRVSSRYPVLQVICNNCGYVLTFNARVAGLAPEHIVAHAGTATGFGGAFDARGVVDKAGGSDSATLGTTHGRTASDDAGGHDSATR